MTVVQHSRSCSRRAWSGCLGLPAALGEDGHERPGRFSTPVRLRFWPRSKRYALNRRIGGAGANRSRWSSHRDTICEGRARFRSREGRGEPEASNPCLQTWRTRSAIGLLQVDTYGSFAGCEVSRQLAPFTHGSPRTRGSAAVFRPPATSGSRLSVTSTLSWRPLRWPPRHWRVIAGLGGSFTATTSGPSSCGCSGGESGLFRFRSMRRSHWL